MNEPKATLAEAMAAGVAHQQAGRLKPAETAYRAVLEVRPEHPGANHNLGLIALAAKQAQDACFLIARAIAAAPDQAIFRNSYGEALSAADRPHEARVAFGDALRLAPNDPIPHNNLGLVLIRLGRTAEGVAEVTRALELNPRHERALSNMVAFGPPEAARRALAASLASGADEVSAGAQLAALGFGPPPERAPEAHMQKLYQARAANWPNVPGYRGPELVANALRARITTPVDLLDAGCGNGLVGPLVRPVARRLVGVDISEAMLERARAGGVYDALLREDLVDHLVRNPAAYDAIAGAAILIHFGDLAPVFRGVAGALRPGGLFVFTAFPRTTSDDGFGVDEIDAAAGGVFFHGRRYVEETARAAGLELVSMTDEAHEPKDKALYYALLVVLRRP